MTSDKWERHEADVMMAYMAAPVLGNFNNCISLIIDTRGKSRLMIPLVEVRFRLNRSNRY